MGNIFYNKNLDVARVDKCVTYLNIPFEQRDMHIYCTIYIIKTVYLSKFGLYFINYYLQSQYIYFPH